MDVLAQSAALADVGAGWLAWLATVSAKGTLLLAAAFAVTGLLRGRSAATRHLVWTAALGGVLLMLVAAPLVPAWEVALLPASFDTAAPAAPNAPAARPAAPAPAALSLASTPVPPRAHLAPGPLPTASPADVPVVTTAPSSAIALPAAVPSLAPPPRMPMSVALVALWLLGAALVLARLAFGTVGVRRIASRAHPVSDPDWIVLAQRLAWQLGVRRPVTLLESGRRAVPVTWGIVYPVILLPADAHAWTAERRRVVLLHELAHVARLDALTHVVTQLAAAAFWFNPLVWVAARRVRAECERACDDVVIASGERASRYANDLLEIVTTLPHAGGPAFAALAMARRTEIEGRLLAILDPAVSRARIGRRAVTAAALIAGAAVVPLTALRLLPHAAHAAEVTDRSRAMTAESLYEPDAFATTESQGGNAPAGMQAPRSSPETAPAAPAQAAPVASGSAAAAAPASAASAVAAAAAASRAAASSTDGCGDIRGRFSVNGEGPGTIYRVSDDDHCLEVRTVGRVEFTDDDADVRSISSGGYLIAQETRGGVTRRAEIRERGGRLERTYWVDGKAAPTEQGEAWLRATLPDIVRESGIGAEARVARIRRERGARGVLAEVSRLKTDHVKRIYLESLLNGAPLPSDTLQMVARVAGESLSSDGDKATVLRRVAGARRGDPALGSAVVQASRSIASDGDKRRVLEAVLDEGGSGVPPAQIVDAVRGISSDGDKAAILVRIAPRFQGDDALRRVYFDAVRTISSDGDRRRVLMHALEGEAMPTPALVGLLESTGEIGSDGDKATVLTAVARRYPVVEEPVRRAFFAAANTIGSDHDRATVLSAVLKRDSLPPATVLDLLRSTGQIGSDNDKANVLLEVASRTQLKDPEVRRAFFGTLKTVGSSSDYRRVMETVAQ